jgi:hypothetical protein
VKTHAVARGARRSAAIVGRGFMGGLYKSRFRQVRYGNRSSTGDIREIKPGSCTVVGSTGTREAGTREREQRHSGSRVESAEVDAAEGGASLRSARGRVRGLERA